MLWWWRCRIEAEYKKGQKRVKVDDERFVDVTHMLQRRYDDETKRREVKREEPPAGTDNDSSEEEEEEEAEADNDDDDDDDDDVGTRHYAPLWRVLVALLLYLRWQ